LPDFGAKHVEFGDRRIRLDGEGEEFRRMAMTLDPFTLAGETFRSRLLLGTAGYPTQRILIDAAAASGCEIVTVSIRRISLQRARLRHRQCAVEIPVPSQHGWL
jgi:hypothetical protein